MSSYFKLAKRPYDKTWDVAFFIDDFFGHYAYGVRFSDGVVLRMEEVTEVIDGVDIMEVIQRGNMHQDVEQILKDRARQDEEPSQLQKHGVDPESTSEQ
jgi:hypothetical protein